MLLEATGRSSVAEALAWLGEGHTGTVGDFMSSLHGQDGTNGHDGSNGVNGKDGAPGLAGKDGAPGSKGDTGPQGPQISTATNSADVCLNSQGKIVAFAACTAPQKNAGGADKTIVFYVAQ